MNFIEITKNVISNSKAIGDIIKSLATKSAIGHTHTDYAPTEHNHSGYATTVHGHSEYSPMDHTHDNYSLSTHYHDNYLQVQESANFATANHTHNSLYSAVDHTHEDYVKLVDIPKVSICATIIKTESGWVKADNVIGNDCIIEPTVTGLEIVFDQGLTIAGELEPNVFLSADGRNSVKYLVQATDRTASSVNIEVYTLAGEIVDPEEIVTNTTFSILLSQ